MKSTYLAVDFGGGSGRVMAGYIDEGKLILEEVHRFGNRQVKLGNHVYWDFPALFQDMKDGLKKAAQKGYQVKSIGIDTWGVDFGTAPKCSAISATVAPLPPKDPGRQPMITREGSGTTIMKPL